MELLRTSISNGIHQKFTVNTYVAGDSFAVVIAQARPNGDASSHTKWQMIDKCAVRPHHASPNHCASPMPGSSPKKCMLTIFLNYA